MELSYQLTYKQVIAGIAEIEELLSFFVPANPDAFFEGSLLTE
jgi:hypothetical protein